MSAVYKIVNTTNGKVYIGSTACISRRRSNHFWRLSVGAHHAPHLQAAYDKYGAEAFAFEVIEEVRGADLRAREQHWIDALNSCDPAFGYNTVRRVGENRGAPHREETLRRLSEMRKGKFTDRQRAALKRITDGNRGKTRSPETVEKVRRTLIGRSLSQESREKISASVRGFTHTEKARRAISKALSERVCSDETRAKHSARWKGVPKPREQVEKQSATAKGKYLGAERYNARGVIQLTTEGEVVAVYDSGATAARATGVSNSMISAVIAGRRKSAGGFLWCRPKDEDRQSFSTKD